MKAIDYNYACLIGTVPEVIKVWLSRSDLPWKTRSKVLTDWRNQKLLLNIPYEQPIDRYEHDLSYQQKYLEKVLFKL